MEGRSTGTTEGETTGTIRRQDVPLAARMRPQTLDEIVGQEHILGPGKMLTKAIAADRVPSLVLWGPPGSGKTTLARVIARITQAYFAPVSAVSAGVADLRKIVKEASERRAENNSHTILFIDEIHRFSKNQQDAILPHVEEGIVTLIGATTENPSFEVNSALLSRSRVVMLKPLTAESLDKLIDRAVTDTRGLAHLHVELAADARAHLLAISDGDARSMLNTLELAALSAQPGADGRRAMDLPAVEDAAQQRYMQYDRAGEGHYDAISALHKSVRDSDPDGTLYWLGRMLEAGEDPLFVARRLVRMSSEDIGLADPNALGLAMAAQQAAHFVGMPECSLAIAQAAVYLALAPKSNALYTAYKLVQEDVARTRNESVPMHLRNAPTGLMKKLGYGQGYKYAHDYDGALVEQSHLPESLKGREYYRPVERGYEAKLKARMEEWAQRRKANSSPRSED
ncbi:MAG: replication-associated recombination protein A [Chloroflexota bacterium]|nr:replication-associated recombination protein A [Chloroflexota bacterium]